MGVVRGERGSGEGRPNDSLKQLAAIMKCVPKFDSLLLQTAEKAAEPEKERNRKRKEEREQSGEPAKRSWKRSQ